MTAIVAKGNLLFAGAKEAGIFISSDKGITWASANNGLLEKNITSFALKGDTVFAGGFFSGVYFSTGNGTVWQPLSQQGLGNHQVTTLAMKGKTLFAGTVNGMYVTTNFKDWSSVNSGMPAGNSPYLYPWVNSISVFNNIMIAGLFFKGAFLSTNSGVTWTSVSDIPNNANVSSAISFNNLLYVGTNLGLFVSANNGVSWSAIGANLPANYYINCLAANATNLYAATALGLYRSSDNGSTWEYVNTNGADWVNTIFSSDSDIFIGTYAGGIKHSINGGSSWDLRVTGLTALAVESIVVQKNYIIASTSNGLYRTSNNVELWERISPNPINGKLITKGDTLLAMTFSSIRFSTDYGTNFNFFPTDGLTLGINGILLAHKGNIYAAAQEGLMVFPAKGNKWVKQNTGGTQYEYFSNMVAIQDTLFVGTWSDKLYVSNNNGVTWSNNVNGLSDPFSHGMTSIGGKVLISNNSGVFKTDDKGLNWTRVNTGTSYNFFGLFSGSEILMGGTLNSGAYFSPDRGSTWINTIANESYPSKFGFKTFCINEGTLFAGTTEGVWVRALSDFYPRIVAFSPTSGAVGASVTVTGENFSAVPGLNAVKVNGVTASVEVASNTNLIIKIPPGATIGPIAITVNGRTIQSVNTFCVAEAKPTIAVANIGTSSPVLTSSSTTGNRWILNGNLIEGATSQTYSPKEPGIYTVRVTNGTCLSEPSDGYNLIITSLEPILIDKRPNIFPMPFENELSINLEYFQGHLPVHISLCDMLGREGGRWETTGGQILKLATQNYQSGFYVVTTQQVDKIYKTRVTKK